MYETLFSELRFENCTIKNRIAFCSPITGFSHDGQPSARLKAYYLERAKGGTGLIELEAGLKYQENWITEWSEIAEQIHAYGARLVAALEDDVDPAVISVIRRAGIDGVALTVKNRTEISGICRRTMEICRGLLFGVHIRERNTNTQSDCSADTLILHNGMGNLQDYMQAVIMKNVDFPEPERCETFLQQEGADLVTLSKQLVCDPFWPAKAEMGKDNEIRRYDLIDEEDTGTAGVLRCPLNPFLGQEGCYSESAMPIAALSKTVVVVGGGPTGMQAAITASKRGHRVFLLERAEALGGRLLPGKRAAAKWMVAEMKRHQVDVRIGLPVMAEHIAVLNPDAIIMAVGESIEKKGLIFTLRGKKLRVLDANDADCSIGQAIRNGFHIAVGI